VPIGRKRSTLAREPSSRTESREGFVTGYAPSVRSRSKSAAPSCARAKAATVLLDEYALESDVLAHPLLELRNRRNVTALHVDAGRVIGIDVNPT
jgi:hypothetical protein